VPPFLRYAVMPVTREGVIALAGRFTAVDGQDVSGEAAAESAS